MRAVPSGTVGGRIAIAPIPCFSKCRAIFNAASSVPTIKGTIWELEPAVSYPRIWRRLDLGGVKSYNAMARYVSYVYY